MTASEWADENFYLSAESSGRSGRWKTRAWQVAILNVMGDDEVEVVDFQKCAKIGYSKMFLAAVGYHAAYKNRNVGIWLPTDENAKKFTLRHVDTAIRDIPVWRDYFPDFGKKSNKNTSSYKQFAQSILTVLGATTSKNFQDLTLDVVALDEFDRFPHDIDGEGSAEDLSWKRTETSPFRKQIKGCSPTEKGSSQIEASMARADCNMQYHVKCPECGELGPVVFGSQNSKSGLKWKKDNPSTVLHHCTKCFVGWPWSKLAEASSGGIWVDVDRGLTTKDGNEFHLNGQPVPKPRHIGFSIWTGYSEDVSWSSIVSSWIAAQGDPLKLKPFVNTTLGETWEDSAGDHIKVEQIRARPLLPMPEVLLVTAAVDVQGDRFELQYTGHCLNGDMVPVGYEIIPAEMDRLADWRERLLPKLDRKFEIHGRELTVEATAIDTGGGVTAIAYQFCAMFADRQVYAFKGGRPGTPLAPLRPSKNYKKVGLNGWTIGVNAGKDLFFAMLARTDGDQRFYCVEGVELPDDYYDQITSEVRRLRMSGNSKIFKYEKIKPNARNEALDLNVYSIALLELLRTQRGLKLSDRAGEIEVDYSGMF